MAGSITISVDAPLVASGVDAGSDTRFPSSGRSKRILTPAASSRSSSARPGDWRRYLNGLR